MRLTSRGIALLCCLAVSACGQHSSSTPLLPSSVNAVSRPSAALSNNSAFKSLYSFGKIPNDGQEPTNLVALNGVFYGTAFMGGANGGGMVFSMTKEGTEVILHNFSGKKDGYEPIGPLINITGVLYGTTSSGGPSNAGVVFSINPNGNFKVIRAFQGGSSDGAGPIGGLTDVSGTLYGTTELGGANDMGTVYSITTGGVEHVLHSFSGSNGSTPFATLIEVNGMLYGTTVVGGANNVGTLFRINTAGNAKVLHSFGGTGDGAGPYYGALVNVNGTLYGTTTAGGATDVGTIFKSSLAGNEKVLYSFDGTPANGCAPYSGLIEFKGTLYGTSNGGTTSPCISNGTIFSMHPSGGETTIHTFSGGKGGYEPFGLTPMGKKLYGTALSGGYHGQGLFYSITP